MVLGALMVLRALISLQGSQCHFPLYGLCRAQTRLSPSALSKTLVEYHFNYASLQ